jgi:hypothetical protein
MPRSEREEGRRRHPSRDPDTRERIDWKRRKEPLIALIETEFWEEVPGWRVLTPAPSWELVLPWTRV